MLANIPSVKDNATSSLASTINASTLTIPVATGEGTFFPQPYNGTATSLGSTILLNCTGISATIGGSAAVGKPIFNATDGSIAFIKSVATNAVTTTPLLGGTDNTWQNGDTWRIDEFVVTFEEISTSSYGVESVTTREEALVIARSTDTLTVATGGRGYNGTTANTFDAGDKVRLLVSSPNHQRIVDYLYELAKLGESIYNLALTSTGNGASMVGIEDAGGNFTGTTVEAALTELDTRLDSAVTLSQIGIYGDGSDGVPTWTSGASLDPSTEKRYTTATLPVSQTLTVSSVNTPLVIHNSGNVEINGTIDLNGKGGAGGTTGGGGRTGSSGSGTAGGAGTVGNTLISGYTSNAGSGGNGGDSTPRGGGGGGGGASAVVAGSTGSTGSGGAGATGGAGGSLMTAQHLAFLASFLRGVACGSGGGVGGGGGRSGGSSDGTNGGAGGAGGGALVWMIGGNLTLGASSVIRANGSTGSNGAAGVGAGGGGGGGGGAGMILIIVRGTITNNGVTLTVSGGSGGTGGGTGDVGGTGATGAAGRALIYSLSTGTLITA